jgi:phosphatidate cytidylyltransferase
MLKQRIITALVLLMVLLPALAAVNPLPFAGLAALFIAAAAWEWCRLNGVSLRPALGWGAAVFVICLLLWVSELVAHVHQGVWLVMALIWVVFGVALLHAGVGRWQRLAQSLRLPLGWVALVVAWCALVQAKSLGVNFLLSVLALVWTADVTAYFAGRALGGRWVGRKLAASISPGKSWEGAVGGALGVVVLALLWRMFDGAWGVASPSLYSLLAQRGLPVLVASVVFLAAMSVVGDLLESLVKRSAGMKDSSHLLPGHGGVLDRVDALLPVLPLAMWLITI